MAVAGESLSGQVQSGANVPKISGDKSSNVEEFLFGAGDSLFIPPHAIPVTSESQQIGLDQLLVFLSDTLAGFKPGVSSFGGKVPGPTDLQSASLTGLERIAAGDSTAFQDPNTLLVLDALKGILTGGPERFDEAFETGVAAPAQRDLDRALRALTANFVGSGNLFGGDRERAVNETIENFFRNLTEERGRFTLHTLGQDRQDKLAAASAIPALSDRGVDLAERLFNIGEKERQFGLQQFEADFADRQRQDQIVNAILNLLLQASTSPIFGTTGGFELSSPQSSGGFLGGIFEGLF